jgi:AraC-like DNA-binding protein
MAVRFDLASLAPDDRGDAIRDLSRSLNGQIEVALPSHPTQLRAVATSSALGPVEVAGIHWNVAGLRRTADDMADDVEPHVFVGFQESGVSRYVQGGRAAEIRPGDVVVLETVQPYTVSFGGTVHTATVRVPTHTLGLPQRLLKGVTAVRLGRDLPVVDAAAAFFSRLVRNQSALDGDDAAVGLAQPCIELIRAVLTTAGGRDDLAEGPLHDTLAQRVIAYLRLHLAEGDLTADRIAAAHHVSVRQLYLTLSRAGISLGDWVRAERLEECRRELASPVRAHLTIEAVARRWGFASAPHFSRVFRSRYGMSPREWRRGNLRSGAER